MSRYALILAAGRGERLWPLTSTRPKPLLPLPDGQSIISRLIRQVYYLVDGVVVVVSNDIYGELVRKELTKTSLPVMYAVQHEKRGTAAAIEAGLKKLPRSVDEVLIIHGDLFVDNNIFKLIDKHTPPVLIGYQVSNPWEYGIILTEQGCLSDLLEKPEPSILGEAPPLINTGIYILERDLLGEAIDKVKPSKRGEYEATDALKHIAQQKCIKVLHYDGFWIDIGRPWDLFSAYNFVLKTLIKNTNKSLIEGEVESYVEIKGPVVITKNAIIRSYTVVEGPAYIDGEVGPLARVRPGTFLLARSYVGSHTEVKNSILFSSAKAPHLNYVGDSIIGENVNLGAGTVTANLRFDHKTIKMLLKGRVVDSGLKKFGTVIGDYAQTGVNVSILPGKRIGAYSWVYPGLVVSSDVPDCKMALPSPKRNEIEYIDISKKARCPNYLASP